MTESREDGAAGEGVAAALGRFVAGSDWAAIPEAARLAARRTLLNHLGCALGVARDPAMARLAAVLRPFSGAPTATVIGQAERMDAMAASFLNAVAGNLLDYDDTHLETVIHPAAPVAPPVLALAEQRGLPGQAVLHALLLGMEVECRIGNAVSPGHYARGWHITATCGVFGAAAASARLLGLPAPQVAHALGIAASQSAGLVENLPNAAKNVGVGNAARGGLLAALLAEAGCDAAPRAIEGALGWARAMGDAPSLAAITGELGTQWEAARNTFKPYPAGIVFHAVIDAALALREALGAPAAGAIAAVEVAGDALLLARGDRGQVRSAGDARVSIHHCAAVALLRGRAGVGEFAAAAAADPEVDGLRARVRAVLQQDLPRGAARVALRLADGRVAERTVLAARGSAQRPLTDAELAEKFRDNAALGGLADRAAPALEALQGIEAAPGIAGLMALLRP